MFWLWYCPFWPFIPVVSISLLFFIVKNVHLNAPSEAYLGAESVRLGRYEIPFRGSVPLPKVGSTAVTRP